VGLALGEEIGVVVVVAILPVVVVVVVVAGVQPPRLGVPGDVAPHGQPPRHEARQDEGERYDPQAEQPAAAFVFGDVGDAPGHGARGA
jgi:hypothetical protein